MIHRSQTIRQKPLLSVNEHANENDDDLDALDLLIESGSTRTKKAKKNQTMIKNLMK